jgi:hypothetical protein
VSGAFDRVVAALGDRVTHHRDGQVKARCPAHPDHNASLSVEIGDEGAILHCRAGCTKHDIVAALGLTMRDLFDAPRPAAAPVPVLRPSSAAAVYDYRAVDGTLLHQVVRRADKSFTQRQPDGKGGWTWSGAGPRVPYRLPELVGQPVVWVVEGERDVDALWAIGLPATCNRGGAGKWADAETQALVEAGVREVFAVPDHDVPGRKHATSVVEQCRAAGLAATLVPLPGLPAHGDVSDYLTAGGTAETLQRLATAAQATPATAATASTAADRTPIVTFLSTVTPEAVDYLWPSRIARGKLHAVAGEPGVGKTYLMLDLTARISRGGRLPDGAIAPLGNVLILTAEDGLSDTVRPRLDALGGDPSRVAVLEAVREANGTRSALSLVRDVSILAAVVREVKPLLVWIDPVNAYLGQTDTHRDSEVRAALAPLTDLAQQEGFALVMVGHLSKDAQKSALHRPGGSIAFVAASRIVLAVATDPHDPERRLLAPIKSNICRPAAVLAYRVTEAGLTWDIGAVDISPEDIFRSSSPVNREDETDAAKVLSTLLADTGAWPIPAAAAIEAGREHGIPERTLRWTAKRAGVSFVKEGRGAAQKWVWHLPEPEAATQAATNPMAGNVAAIAACQNTQYIYEKSVRSSSSGNGRGAQGEGVPEDFKL